ncbi:Uma2 family endonuclease [Streptomyces sp. SID3343]|uniref:Uma2 family endonuclease n=1 Tax=Streptomyces sp. SID3343 TaxID=2690260 RepID=UPI00136C3F1B|nr:Uma2 family endonuclease [Streptomyces sp. SID3343]MYW02851.1 hypothetical protein [Streptomyces sp. SID3343]
MGIEALRRAQAELDEEFRSEIVQGKLIVSPSGTGMHNLIGRRLGSALAVHGLVPLLDTSMAFPNLDSEPRPDVTLVPAGADLDVVPVPGDLAELMAEITSPSTRKQDLATGDKYEIYAKGRVPLYLLVDRTQRHAVLYLDPDPAAGMYRSVVGPVPFGHPLRIPAPFDLTLDTGILG